MVAEVPQPYSIVGISPRDWPRWRGQVMAIEEACFEPARRGTEAHLLDVLRETGSIGAIATEEDRVVGFCMGAPLEFFREMEWVKDDPEFGRRTTLYAADLIVSPDHQRQGIGAALKANQIDRARRAGHLYITGRYRVRLAEGMGRISRKWGAYEVQYLRDSYADDLEPRDAVYYRIDL